MFYYYKKLIELRKQNEIIVYGTYELILEDDEEIYAFTRTLGEDKVLVICNFTNNSPTFNLPKDIDFTSTELLISNYETKQNEDISKIVLKPYEARVYRLKK
ncbi:hypothetical protein CON36_37545 [Bacillus cereus]|uniref:Alpha-amylase SusG-like C-terminal domain-containing protein n=1 Tax=Bacillus cereus TaxID=1396 RepID=A0A9X6SR85_BACCE|nr:hypothetical protein CON36_37545 [Bacillus cereus]